LRRINKDAVKIKPRIEEILGHDSGYNGQLQRTSSASVQSFRYCPDETMRSNMVDSEKHLSIIACQSDHLRMDVCAVIKGHLNMISVVHLLRHL